MEGAPDMSRRGFLKKSVEVVAGAAALATGVGVGSEESEARVSALTVEGVPKMNQFLTEVVNKDIRAAYPEAPLVSISVEPNEKSPMQMKVHVLVDGKDIGSFISPASGLAMPLNVTNRVIEALEFGGYIKK